MNKLLSLIFLIYVSSITINAIVAASQNEGKIEITSYHRNRYKENVSYISDM